MVGRCFSQYPRPELNNSTNDATNLLQSQWCLQVMGDTGMSWKTHERFTAWKWRIESSLEYWAGENSTGSGCGELSWKPLCTCNATYIVGWDGLKQIPNVVAVRWTTALPCNICDNQATLSLPSRGNTTLWLHRWKRNQYANFNLHSWKTSEQNYPN